MPYSGVENEGILVHGSPTLFSVLELTPNSELVTAGYKEVGGASEGEGAY